MSSHRYNVISSSNSSSMLVSSSPKEKRTTNNVHITSVIIGDAGIGKSSLVISYTTNDFPTEYVPTAFDNYSVDVSVGSRVVHFDICDTGGKEQFSSLHGLCIPYSDVILLCFSVVSPQSFQNATTYWLSRARRCNATIPIILVGTQMDLRSDLKTLLRLDEQNLKPVMENEARQRAQQMQACAYIECSALTEKNLKVLFDTAVLTAMEYRNGDELSTIILPSIEQQTSISDKPRTRTWRKLVSNCIGI